MLHKFSKDVANQAHKTLRAALNQAVKDGLLIRNPIDAIEAFKLEKIEKTLWSLEEIDKFLTQAKGHRLFAAFYLALSVGMRHGEILGLRWQDVDLENGVLHVRQNLVALRSGYAIGSPKTRSSKRTVRLDSETIVVLKQYKKQQQEKASYLGDAWGSDAPEEKDLVFTSYTGRALNPRSFDSTWHKLREKSGVSKMCFHGLRDTYISLLNKRGVDLRTIADRVGHANPRITMDTYTHSFEDQHKNAAIPLSELLPKS